MSSWRKFLRKKKGRLNIPRNKKKDSVKIPSSNYSIMMFNGI